MGGRWWWWRGEEGEGDVHEGVVDGDDEDFSCGGEGGGVDVFGDVLGGAGRAWNEMLLVLLSFILDICLLCDCSCVFTFGGTLLCSSCSRAALLYKLLVRSHEWLLRKDTSAALLRCTGCCHGLCTTCLVQADAATRGLSEQG